MSQWLVTTQAWGPEFSLPVPTQKAGLGGT